MSGEEALHRLLERRPSLGAEEVRLFVQSQSVEARTRWAEEHVLGMFSEARREARLSAERGAAESRARAAVSREWTLEEREEYEAGQAVKRERNLALMRELDRVIERQAQQLAIEWTQDLLGTTFGLPDGTLTTWGEATVEQHRERLRMFTAQAVTGIEGAARHRQAIQEIEGSGAACLAEAVRAGGHCGTTVLRSGA